MFAGGGFNADVTQKVSVGEVVGKITGDVEVATDGTATIAAGVIVDADVKVSLCNDADGEYEQVFGSPEELQCFIDHLMVIADEAWPSVDEHGYPLQLGDFYVS